MLGLWLWTSVGACPFQHLLEEGELPDNHPDVFSRRRLLETGVRAGPDAGTTTNLGCTCKSECSATIDFDNANCDWCETENNCGHYSITHFKYYDYCVYPVQDSESRTAETKHNQLWTEITADATHGSYPNPIGIVGESIQTSFDDQWDVMPSSRSKYIHGVGIVCDINFEITTDKYTGVFEKGSHSAFLRLGSATEPSSGTTPGIGMKFLRTGVKSANWVMLYSLDGGSDYNMFGYNQTNHIAPPTGATQVLATKFLQASNCVVMVGLSDAGTWNQDGVEVASPEFPFMLKYVPTGKARVSSDGQSLDALLSAMLKATPAGVELYEIWGQETPTSALEVIGSITTTKQCVTSKFGDEKLYFRHQRIEEDFAIKPEWMKDVPPADCWANEITSTPPAKCAAKSKRSGAKVE